MYKNYNINQLVLPLNLEIKIQDNDIARHINNLVEGIPKKAFDKYYKETGCPAYHPRMMLKILLCAYSQSVFSGRKIEALLSDSIRMMWLAQGYSPSYRTINRFRSNKDMQELLCQCFIQFRAQLIKEKIINNEAIFIDGTKIEANANKFSFVWKKAVEKYGISLIENSRRIYDELVEQEIIPAMELEQEATINEKEMVEVVEKLDSAIEVMDKKIAESDSVEKRKRIRHKRKRPKQLRKILKDNIARKQKYDRQLAIMENRNSYSKTDPDATFMRMKEDYMKNGQLKPGYNVQIATEGQYALAYDLFPNPTDTRTLKPFLDVIESSYFALPEYIVADAGYGSEENYVDIIENRQLIPLITYGMYLKEQERRYKKDAFKTANWDYDNADDYYTCPNGKKLIFKYNSQRKDKNGFARKFRVYECEDCCNCPYRSQCCKAKEGNNRKISINVKWEQQKEYIRAQLSDKKTGKIYKRRKIDVEPVFGFLKANLRFNRFTVRGKFKAKIEMGLALMAVNLRKYMQHTAAA